MPLRPPIIIRMLCVRMWASGWNPDKLSIHPALYPDRTKITNAKSNSPIHQRVI
ncbi:hypothetical protein RvY_03688 [Ramazzottius varieornatus]|uniref:Uncharacterized protein n=1 Tax=Ramazzottius varieornatus TaxID=947166 RepID=A0A1D1UW39_RAMVA|nr:hypothetical protein RvY_03688 [Ramazzottius varieornatus]